MPKMPESDAKEETAESIAEKKEQVFIAWKIKCLYLLQWKINKVKIDWDLIYFQ